MPCPFSKTLKTYAFAWSVVFLKGLSLGNIQLSFPQATMDVDLTTAIDSNENFGDDAEMINNIVNVFTVAFVAYHGNLKVGVRDRNTMLDLYCTDGSEE